MESRQVFHLPTHAARPLRLREFGAASGHLGEDPDVEDVLARSSSRRLLCAACGEPITTDEHRVAIEGRHRHRRTNPVGFEFDFGCFREAPGAAVGGEATRAHTWFTGFSWRFSICGSCGFHLGWRFEGEGSAFHGLVLNRLEAEKSEET